MKEIKKSLPKSKYTLIPKKLDKEKSKIME
jgi:hypothetical protein